MKTYKQLEIEEDLRSRNPGMMTAAQIGRELGITKHSSIMKFLDGLPAYEINGRKKWRLADIAKRLSQLETY